jgi:translation elongation factor EF-1beta
VSDKALETLTKVMYTQDEYGFKKYGTELRNVQKYDWLQMFLEEIADGLKYIQNEMDRKQQVIKLLENFMETGEKAFVEGALYLLEIEGTGKEENHG